MTLKVTEKDDIPKGWTYNPSTWGQRTPIIILAVIGTVIAAYLAMFQFAFVRVVWEPFFGIGSRKILNSDLSYVLPVPDAALGTLAYLLDALTGAVGGTKRWRTMPWIVIIFAIFVGPLGAVSIGLVMAQPLLYDAWCTLCLATAAISLFMVGPAMDEALASLQFMRRVYDADAASLWKVFWGISEQKFE